MVAKQEITGRRVVGDREVDPVLGADRREEILHAGEENHSAEGGSDLLPRD